MTEDVSISDYLVKFQDLRKLPYNDWEQLRELIHELGRHYYQQYPNQLFYIQRSLQQLFGSNMDHQSKPLYSKVLFGIYEHYAEKLFNCITSENSLRNFIKTRSGNHGLETLRTLLKDGRGVLLITGHVGGIEFLPAYLCCNGIPSAIVAKFNSEELLKLSERQSARFSNHIINAASDNPILPGVFRQLQNNRVVITLCDEMESWRPYQDQSVHFLGQTVKLDRTLDIIYRHHKPAVVFALMHRRPEGRYHLILSPLVSPYMENGKFGNPSVSALALSALDQYIHRFPEGWYQWSKFDQLQAFACKTSPKLESVNRLVSNWTSQLTTA